MEMNEYRIFLTGDVAGAWKRLVGRYYWLHDNNIIAHLLEMHNLWCKEACLLDLSQDTQTSGTMAAIEKPDLIPSASNPAESELRDRLQGDIPTESITGRTETNVGQTPEQNVLIKEELESMEFTESINPMDNNSLPYTPGTMDPGGGDITGEETPTTQSALPVIVSVESLASVGQHPQGQQPVGQHPQVQQPVGQQVGPGAQKSVIHVPRVRLVSGGQQLLLLMNNGQNSALSVNQTSTPSVNQSNTQSVNQSNTQSVNTNITQTVIRNTAQLVNQCETPPENQSSPQSADSSTGNISKDLQGREAAGNEPVSRNRIEQEGTSTSLGDDPQNENQFSDAFHIVAWDASYHNSQPRQYIRQCHYNCLCCARLQLGHSCSCNTLRESCATQTTEYDTLPSTVQWDNLWKKGTFEHSSLQKLIMNAIERYDLKDSKDLYFTTAVNDIMAMLVKANPTLHQSTQQTTCNTEKKIRNRVQKALEWRRYYSRKRSSAEDDGKTIRSVIRNKKPKETDKENLTQNGLIHVECDGNETMKDSDGDRKFTPSKSAKKKK